MILEPVTHVCLIIPFSLPSSAPQIAEYIARRVSLFKPSAEKTHFVLGLPTGSSPLPVYQRLVELYKEGKVSFKVSLFISEEDDS